MTAGRLTAMELRPHTHPLLERILVDVAHLSHSTGRRCVASLDPNWIRRQPLTSGGRPRTTVGGVRRPPLTRALPCRQHSDVALQGRCPRFLIRMLLPIVCHPVLALLYSSPYELVRADHANKVLDRNNARLRVTQLSDSGGQRPSPSRSAVYSRARPAVLFER